MTQFTNWFENCNIYWFAGSSEARDSLVELQLKIVTFNEN